MSQLSLEMVSSLCQTLMCLLRNGVVIFWLQGGWEIDEATAEEAAKRETVEEAGVRGRLEVSQH